MLLYLQKYFLYLGANEQTSGILVSIAIIPFVCLSMISGHWANNLGAKRLVVIGCVIHSAVALCYLYVDQISSTVYFYRFLQGVGHVCVFTPLFVEIGKIVPDSFKARGIGYFAVAIQFGTASGSAFGEYLITTCGYQMLFIAVSTITSICAVICMFVTVDAVVDDVGLAINLQDKNASTKIPAAVIGGLVMILVLGSVFGTILQFIPTYFDELLSSARLLEPISYKFFLTSGLLTVAFVRIIGGGVTDGRHRDKIVAFCHSGLLIAIILITIIRSVDISIIVSVIFGLSYGLLYPATNAMVLTQTSSRIRGKVSGLLTMLFEMGFRGFALFAGMIVHHISYEMMFYLLFVFYFIGIMVYYYLRRVSGSKVVIQCQ